MTGLQREIAQLALMRDIMTEHAETVSGPSLVSSSFRVVLPVMPATPESR